MMRTTVEFACCLLSTFLALKSAYNHRNEQSDAWTHLLISWYALRSFSTTSDDADDDDDDAILSSNCPAYGEDDNDDHDGQIER